MCHCICQQTIKTTQVTVIVFVSVSACNNLADMDAYLETEEQCGIRDNISGFAASISILYFYPSVVSPVSKVRNAKSVQYCFTGKWMFEKEVL